MFRYIAMTSLSLLAVASVLSAQEAAPAALDEAPLAADAQAWEDVRNSTSAADLFDFIQGYPDSAYVQEAKARMVDLLYDEMAENPAPASDITTDQEVVTVTFSQPLQVGAPEVVGRTIEELILGRPLYPPVEGLPAEYWEEQQCSSCHEWEQTNLCVQANTYLTDAGSENLTKQHPYGGTFKMNLRNWAVGGCE